MRRRLSALAVLVMLVALPQLAFATLIHNSDSRDHTVKLRQGSGSVSATVKANKAVSFRCPSYPCRVQLGDSVLTIRSSADDVLIKNGKLVRKPKLAVKN